MFPLSSNGKALSSFPVMSFNSPRTQGSARFPSGSRIPGSAGYAMTPAQWKKVLLIPGRRGERLLEGRWNIIEWDPEHQWQADPSLFPLLNPWATLRSRRSAGDKLPTLTWQNRVQCKVQGMVWERLPVFQCEEYLSFTGIRSRISMGGAFRRELSSAQWRGIRMLVGDQPGSPIYWYVESWDGLNRNAATEVMFFLLEK